MPLFSYKAVSAAGETQEGEMEGLAQAAIVERLQGMGLIPIRVDETAAKAGGANTGITIAIVVDIEAEGGKAANYNSIASLILLLNTRICPFVTA